MDDTFEQQHPVQVDDSSWLAMIPNGHGPPLNTDLSTENTTPSVMDSHSVSLEADMGHPTTNFLNVASSMDTLPQEEESSARVLAGIKRELESPDEEIGRAKSRRRKGEPEPDYSAMSRQRIKQNKRTGQACDRCKLRKLRCDPDPSGCLPCASIKHPCQVTDRVTGETFLRGEAGHLKTQNEILRAKIVELEETIDQLRSENQSLQAQLFCYEMMQADSASVATGGPSHASDIATPNDTAPESMISNAFAELDS